MASENFDINVNVTGNANQALQQIEKNVAKVNKQFSDFKATVAAIALGSFGTSMIKYADDISDLSKATGIAINNIVGLGKTFQQNGGDADQARQAVIKLNLSIAEAADGGKQAQLAFEDVGIGLKDLQTLSEQEILAKTIEGLAKIEDVSKRSKTAVDLLGKGAKGVDFTGVAEGYATASEAAKKYSDAVKASADLNDKFEAAMSRLKLSGLKVFEPIADAINKLDDDKINKLIDSFVSLAASWAAIAVSLKAFEMIGKVFLYVGGAVTLLGSGLASLGKTVSVLGTQWRGFTGALSAGVPFFEALGTTIGILVTKRLPFLISGLGMLAKGFLGLAGVILIVNDVIDAMTGKNLIGWLSTAVDKTKEFFGIVKNKPELPDTGAGAGRGNAQAELEARNKELERAKKAEQERTQKLREAEDAWKKQKLQLDQNTAAFARQNDEIVKNYNLESTLVGKSEDYVEVQKAIADVQKRTAEEVQKLRDAKALLSKEDEKLIPLYDAQIKKIIEQGKVDEERITKALTGLQSVKLLEQDRLNNLELINQQLQKQATYDESILKIRQQTQEALSQAQFEGKQMGRTPLEQKIEEIKHNAEKAALEAGRAFAAQFENLDMTAADSKRLADGLDLIAQKYKEIADQQTKNLEASRSFSAGWQTAFNEYMDNATNAAKRAGDIFNSITSNMNSAIDNFVETGKFKFSDFARSVIQDLLKIELKAQATQLLKGIQSGAGSLLGSIFGFAEGGNPPINKPSIVGENGPELFVPKTAGTVVPNNQLNNKSTTPTQTNIVYNINAIDSKSVAEFFASNRKTMLGTIQLAQKELPYGNR